MNEQEKQQRRRLMIIGFLVLDSIIVGLVLYFTLR